MSRSKGFWFGRALGTALVGCVALVSAVCQAQFIEPTHHFTFNIDDGFNDQAGGLVGTAEGGAALDTGSSVIGDASLRLVADQEQYVSLYNQFEVPDVGPVLDPGSATPEGPTNAHSVSMATWVRRTGSATGHCPWYAELSAPGNQVRYSFKDGGGRPHVDHYPGSGSPRAFDSGVELPVDEWAHVMYTQNHSSGNVSRNFYVDGVLARTLPNLANYTGDSSEHFLIGYGIGQGDHFDGHMDDMGFWHDVELTAEYAALAHGLGRFSGVSISDPVIGDVLALHTAGQGAVTGVGDGNHIVRYVDNLDPDLPVGSWGGSVYADGAYVVLGTGTGVSMVPEPSSVLLLLVAGCVAALIRRLRAR